jgi:hypothetical protein
VISYKKKSPVVSKKKVIFEKKLRNFNIFITTGKLKIFELKKSHHFLDHDELILKGYHFVGNGQFSRVFLRYRRSKMFPTGFIGVCSLGLVKVIFEDFDKK